MRRSMKPGTLRTVKVSLSVVSSAVLALSAPLMAYAYNIEYGNITITATDDNSHRVEYTDDGGTARTENDDPNPVVTGTSDQFTVTLNADNGDVNVTFDNLTVDASNLNKEAVNVTGSHDVTIELDRTNSLTAARLHAGLEDNLSGTLTIKDANNNGSLIATSVGDRGAGIGGGVNCDGSDIIITGGNITAIGGDTGAGIGGGDGGSGSNITIIGGTVTAIGGDCSAGIGGGDGGSGSNITITGGTVFAIGGISGAGIGGGLNGLGSNITITGSANVSVAGGSADAQSDRYPAGTAIGNGATYFNDVSGGDEGTPVDPDTTGLYTTGIIKMYAPGVAVQQIKNRTVDPVGEPIVGTVPAPEPEHVDPDPEDPDPIVPGPAVPKPTVAGVAVDMSYQRVEESTSSAPGDKDAAFASAVEMQIDDLAREINALIAEGRLDEVNTLIKKGFKINAARNRCLTAATLEKLGELNRMGVPITIDFINEGKAYSVTIKANTLADTKYLLDDKGLCGFMNIYKYFG